MAPQVDILMYHSISDAGGPTNIPPAVFAGQMQALAQSGIPTITPDDLLLAQDGKLELPARSVLLTFDDGFQDFADAAWPILQQQGFTAIVYLPTTHVGGQDVWEPPENARRKLMNWDEVIRLHRQGVLFGSHTVSHADLTRIDLQSMHAEILESKNQLERRIDGPIRHFAAPYGRVNAAVQQAISAHYRTSVGVELMAANPSQGLHDLPRLEMYYYQDLGRWKQYLAGRGDSYLVRRRLLRKLRRMATFSSL